MTFPYIYFPTDSSNVFFKNLEQIIVLSFAGWSSTGIKSESRLTQAKMTQIFLLLLVMTYLFWEVDALKMFRTNQHNVENRKMFDLFGQDNKFPYYI